MLDMECSVGGTTDTYTERIKTHHKDNPKLFCPMRCDDQYFGIKHFTNSVVYNAADFLGENNSIYE